MEDRRAGKGRAKKQNSSHMMPVMPEAADLAPPASWLGKFPAFLGV
jgi:hypothetical protein